MLIRENPYRHRAPPGWNNITAAPRDGTVIEIQNNWGVAATYGIYRWQQGRGWVDATDDCRGVGDGAHLSWRPYSGEVEAYVDPTGGAQWSEEYWDRAVMQATGGRLNPAVERARNRSHSSAAQQIVDDSFSLLAFGVAIGVSVFILAFLLI